MRATTGLRDPVTLATLMKPFSAEWEEQRAVFAPTSHSVRSGSR